MKAIFWTEKFLPDIGGVPVFAGQLIPFLMENYNHRIQVVCCSPKKDSGLSYWNEIPVYRFPFHEALMSRDIQQIFHLKREVAHLIQQFAPNLIHINTNQPSLFFLKAHLASPCLFSAHEPILAKEENSLLGLILNRCRFLTAASKKILDEFRSFSPGISDRSIVIYNGLRSFDLDPAPVPLEPACFLCLGRLVDQKGYDLAITALAALLDKGKKARLSIVGEGPELNRLKALTRNLGISESVSFSGPVPAAEIPSVINQSTAVLIPSKWGEAFGLVAVEANLMGRPVIASRVGGLPEIVIHGQTGYLFEPDDPNALADRMLSILESPENAKKLGSEGKSRVEQCFSLETSAEAFQRVYEKIGGDSFG